MLLILHACFILILSEVGSGRYMRMAPSRRSQRSQVFSQWSLRGGRRGNTSVSHLSRHELRIPQGEHVKVEDCGT